MKEKVIIILSIIAIAMVAFNHCEPFATKREKASAIYDWFNKTPSHSYTDYRDTVKPSNIVEYEDAMNLFKNKNFTVESIEQTL